MFQALRISEDNSDNTPSMEMLDHLLFCCVEKALPMEHFLKKL